MRGTLIVALLALSPQAWAAESAPLVVKAGITLLSIGKLDVASGTYTVDFYLSLRSDQDMGDLHLEFMNGRATSVDKIYDAPTEKQLRYQANLMTNIDVRRYPWDAHALPIILESATRQDKELVFVADPERTGVDEAVVVVGWRLMSFDTHVKPHIYRFYDNESYSQISFDVHIQRQLLTSSLKTFLPVLCFLLIAFTSLIVTVDKCESKIAMNTAMLIASVMFHLSITNQLPPAAYLTIADKALIAAYLVIGLNLLLSVLMMRLVQRDRLAEARRMRERAFTVVPVFAVLAYVIVAVT